jgi:hypothetical protein
MSLNNRSRWFHSALIFALIFAVLFLLHFPLLTLPYFGDEAGYYIPSARDLLLTGSLIPISPPSNAHPPLVMAYLALWWKVAGYAPLVTRTAMLVIAAFSLLGVFQLARRIANTKVAVASVICTALYPVFFAQSSLAHLDLAAAGLTFWGLRAYLDRKRMGTVIWFSLAGLTKETAILAPLALFAWEIFRPILRAKIAGEVLGFSGTRIGKLVLLIPLVPLLLWYLYHYVHTGYVFGNPEFFRYNVQSTLSLQRIVFALLARLWQMFGYMGLYVLTLAALLLSWMMPLRERDHKSSRKVEGAHPAMVSVMSAYLIFMAIIGGAMLARYMLPVVPLAIILCISCLQRRVRLWPLITAFSAVIFILALFVNPPYGFAVEDNLAYRDFIVLHQRAARFLEMRYPKARILTAWPASGEIANPDLGYVKRPFRVQPIEDFSLEQLQYARRMHSQFDVALVFSTKFDPPESLSNQWHAWQEWRSRYFGFHRDEPPESAARILGGHLVYKDSHKGQWVAVIVPDPFSASY